MTQRDEIWITDMSACEPASALAREPVKGCWRAVDYVGESIEGTLIYALEGQDAPALTLPLNVSGWHEIHVGLWSHLNDTCWVEVKLTDDPCTVALSREKPNCHTLEESYWKTADLTGQSLHLVKRDRGAFVAYVRLIPLSEAQVEALLRDRARADTKRLIAHADLAYLGRGIRESIEPYRHTDFCRLYWEVLYGTRCIYPTQVGEYGNDPRTKPVLDYGARGLDPLAMAAQHAHDVGVEIMPSMRVEMFGFPPPRDVDTVCDFYRDHPEWRCVDRDGTPVDRMSYAFPGVRNHLLDILEEMASYDVDGIGLLYHRGPPYLLYEAPLVAGFRDEYGEDPRELDEWDERWLAYRARTMTAFMAGLRARLDSVGDKRGRRLRIGAVVPADPAECRFYGLDVRSWAEQNVVDELIPFPDGHGERQLFFDNVLQWAGDPPRHPIPLAYWTRVVQGTACRLYPAVMPRRMPSREYRRRAVEVYESGADGMFFWDTYNRNYLTEQWRTLRRLGHAEDLPSTRTYEQLEGERPWDGTDPEIPKVSYMWDDDEVRTHKLTRLGGFNVARYPADWAG